MSRQKKQLGQKIILGALFACIFSLTLFSYFNYMESEEKVTFLENEKVMIVEDLQLIQSDFDSLATDNELYKAEIDKTRTRIDGLLDSIRTMKMDYNMLHRFRKELIGLRKENKNLHRITDSINQINVLLSREIDSTKLKVVALTRYSRQLEKANEKLTSVTDSLETENVNLARKITGEKVMRVSGLEGTAFKIKTNGKVILTNRVSRTDRLRACFNISPNTLLEAGERIFYLQFIDPENNILGDGNVTSIKGRPLLYSKKVVVDYNNNPLSICDYIIPGEIKEKGDYRVNIYYEDELMATSTFQLK